jgi:ArsR family metal-binding transcriptional regulator
MLTSVYFVGWIMSIYWAYLIVMKAMKDKQEAKEFLSKTNARSD